jgi:hypothetical protein
MCFIDHKQNYPSSGPGIAWASDLSLPRGRMRTTISRHRNLKLVLQNVVLAHTLTMPFAATPIIRVRTLISHLQRRDYVATLMILPLTCGSAASGRTHAVSEGNLNGGE